jgi:hypothetical protein
MMNLTDRSSRMFFLKPHGKIDLDHRAYFLRGTPAKSGAVAAARGGEFSILTPDWQVVNSSRGPAKIQAVSPQPIDRFFALIEGDAGSLVVRSHDGKQLLELSAPDADEDSSDLMKQGFEDCLFDETGDFLWLSVLSNECEVRLIETKSWSVISSAAIEDPFGGSSYSFHPTGDPDVVSLWLAAGQDGQQVYWLRRTGSEFSCTIASKLTNTIPPVFAPVGKHFLVTTERGAVCKYEFSTMTQIGSPLESGDDDNPFSTSLCYLDNRQVLAGTNENRVFLVDTDEMKILEEVAVEGHEPRPIGEYYPALAKETGLGTDISWFTRLCGTVVFVYRRDRGKGLDGWKDSLLWYTVKP